MQSFIPKQLISKLLLTFISVGISSSLFIFKQESIAAPLSSQAITNYKNGNYKQAFEQFQSIVNSTPNDELAHYYLALCSQRLNKQKLAIQQYEWLTKNSKNKSLVDNSKLALAGLTSKSTQANQSSSLYSSQSQSSTRNANLPQVIDFSATWCGPCKRVAPIFDKISTAYRGRVSFVHIDVDENKQLADQYKINVVPTFVFLNREGKPIFVNQGVMAEEEIVAHTEELIR